MIVLNPIPHGIRLRKTGPDSNYGGLFNSLPGLSGSVRPKTEACDSGDQVI